jgi:hypothetical protein
MADDISEDERKTKIHELEAFLYYFGKDDPLYHASKVALQDKFACESQGAITDRTQEHLGKSDVGLTLLRRLIREAVQELDAGRIPRGQLRNAPNEIIRFDNVF